MSKAEMEWADLILTMTTAHKDTVISNYPEAEHKVFTLKEYTNEGSLENVGILTVVIKQFTKQHLQN